MGAKKGRKLTGRQKTVLERIDRRVPIKVIAQEMGVSETRINQHIRALKDFYKVETLNELVELHREERALKEAEALAEAKLKDLSDSGYRKSQVESRSEPHEEDSRVDPGEIVLNDVMPVSGLAPWRLANEPRIVPGVLDGENAVLLRLAAIVGIAFGCLAAVVLTVTAAVAISEALDGRAAIPVDEQGFS